MIGPATVAMVLGGATTLPPLDHLAGVYRYSVPNPTTENGEWSSRLENILEIVPHTSASVYFRVHLAFEYAHFCDIWGIATVADGALVYRGPPSEVDGRSCQLHLAVANGKLIPNDPDSICKSQTCGARGYYNAATGFILSARRPIRYMERLLASPQYVAAVAEYEAEKSAPR
jgi:hypothetical protein